MKKTGLFVFIILFAIKLNGCCTDEAQNDLATDIIDLLNKNRELLATIDYQGRQPNDLASSVIILNTFKRIFGDYVENIIIAQEIITECILAIHMNDEMFRKHVIKIIEDKKSERKKTSCIIL